MLQAACSLRDQGVLGMQLRHHGGTAEVRLQLRQSGGVVEACLRETGRGVEIQLTAGPEQQSLLSRVAETLANQRGGQAFELDGVSVDTHGDPPHSRRQSPGDAHDTEGPAAHRRRRTVGQPGPPLTLPGPPLTLPASVGTNYLR